MVPVLVENAQNMPWSLLGPWVHHSGARLTVVVVFIAWWQHGHICVPPYLERMRAIHRDQSPNSVDFTMAAAL